MLQEEISDNETALTQLEGYARRLEWDNECSTRCLEEEAQRHKNVMFAIDSKISSIEGLLYSISADTSESVKLRALVALEECRLLANSRDYRVVQTWLHAAQFRDQEVPLALRDRSEKVETADKPVEDSPPAAELISTSTQMEPSDFPSSLEQSKNYEASCSCSIM